MSLSQVAAIVGPPGELTSSFGLGASRIDCHRWLNADGTSMQLAVQGGLVYSKDCVSGLR